MSVRGLLMPMIGGSWLATPTPFGLLSGVLDSESTTLSRVYTDAPLLSADQEKRLAEEDRRVMVGRLRWIMPLMIVMNLVHIAITYYQSPFRSYDHTPQVLHWADIVHVVHATTALVALVPTLLLFVSKRPPSWLGPVSGLIYLLHGAVIAGVDQLSSGTILPYLGYALVVSLMVLMQVRTAVVMYSISSLVMTLSVLWFQPDVAKQLSVLPLGFSIAIPTLCIVWFIRRGRRRNFFLQDVVETQRAKLEQLNTQLTAEVASQVAVLVLRSTEVEHLNERLQERVRDRSRELASALRRLARHESIAPDSLEGTVLARRFRLGAQIGSGGMGVVYEAEDLQSGRIVAVKMMGGQAMAPHQLERFLREVELASSVRHPAIVRMLHLDITEDGRVFQVQDRVEGRTIAHCLSRFERFDKHVTLAALAVLADALAAAHAQGVVHRDIKPANMMLIPKAPGLVLLDFGVAKLDRDSNTLDQTATGVVVGTPAYMAPELWSGTREVTPAVDVFGLGVCAFRMLSGHLPHWRDEATTQSPFEQYEESHPDVAAALRACLTPNPSTRPSAAELTRVLSASVDVSYLPRWVRDDALGQRRSTPMDGGDTHLSFA